MWQVTDWGNGNITIEPIDDIREHRLTDEFCDCLPTIEILNGHRLINHNAFDGREAFEKIREIMER